MPILKMKNFYFTYADNNYPALKNINLSIEENRITALIGPSGCGKSTLLRSMNRIHDLYPGHKYEGKIEFSPSNSESVKDILKIKKEKDFIALRQEVGMIFQTPTPFAMSVFDNVAYGLKISGIKNRNELEGRVEVALKDSALWDEVKERLHKPATELSGGQQQRLCISRAIAIHPKILLLDEPTSALDPSSTAAIEELIVKLRADMTIVIVTHNMQQASRISDFTAFMHEGEIVEVNSTENIFLNPKERTTEDYITGRFG